VLYKAQAVVSPSLVAGVYAAEAVVSPSLVAGVYAAEAHRGARVLGLMARSHLSLVYEADAEPNQSLTERSVCSRSTARPR
jgi:hypothetical protein